MRGEPLNITASGDYSLNTDGWYHLRDPRQYLNFNAFEDLAAGNGPDRVIHASATDVNDGTKSLASALNQTTSRVMSQGRIAITARYLNINGLIQSGVDAIDMNITNAFVPPTYLTTLSDLADKVSGFVPKTSAPMFEARQPAAIPGISFGIDNVPLNVTWNPVDKAFYVGRIDPDGGEIIIAGQILSTGGGRLKVASGYASVNIQNDSPYPVILDEIDTTTIRQGKITIIDSDRLTKTEYKVVGANVEERFYVGTSQGSHTAYGTPTVTTHTTGVISYLPRAGLQYIFVDAQTFSETIIRGYNKKSFNLVGDNFIADLLVPDTTFDDETSFPRV